MTEDCYSREFREQFIFYKDSDILKMIFHVNILN